MSSESECNTVWALPFGVWANGDRVNSQASMPRFGLGTIIQFGVVLPGYISVHACTYSFILRYARELESAMVNS